MAKKRAQPKPDMSNVSAILNKLFEQAPQAFEYATKKFAPHSAAIMDERSKMAFAIYINVCGNSPLAEVAAKKSFECADAFIAERDRQAKEKNPIGMPPPQVPPLR